MTDPATTTAEAPEARRLDGNAAAGLLADLFAVELTAADVRCASCGTTSPLGAHHLYADAPAAVVRCPTCAAVVLRVGRRDGRAVLDLRGAGLISVAVPPG